MDNIDSVSTDILIIGGGPAGLATSIHLADILKKQGINRRILLIEKGATIGNHIMSGAVINAEVLKELLPDVEINEIPSLLPVTFDATVLLSETGSLKLPVHVPFMNNANNYIVSLAQVCRYLAQKAEEKGVEIYSGFSLSEILYENGKVCGAKTIDTGIDHNGHRMANFQRGTSIKASLTIFAEGSRGSLTKELINKYKLDEGKNNQMYSLGVKELWSVPEGNIQPGEIYHTMGYPLNMKEFGGGFIYGIAENKVAVGLVVGLDYQDPTFDTHAAFQIWKTTAFVSKFLKGGHLVEYGAKTLPEGGWYALPKLFTDNALIVGDSAGFLTMPALKGVHLAISSGILAAQTALKAIIKNDFSEKSLSAYEELVRKSNIYKEMYPVRNFRQAFAKGIVPGALHFATQIITGGAGLTGRLKSHSDKNATKRISEYNGLLFKERFKGKLEFDKVLTFDKATDVYYSGVNHDEQQVPHLRINNEESFKDINIKQYGAPCVHFCAAEVYELHTDKNGHQEIRIHAENCMHCKTCDIKSPGDGITWSIPNGGNGPEFQNM